ncbi:hypothetical protein HanIR_Chr03g0128621 [Helianthus annuus]|nr:hypothetical protein HanIR_Chr03g0128621 [Helianthus annuus]
MKKQTLISSLFKRKFQENDDSGATPSSNVIDDKQENEDIGPSSKNDIDMQENEDIGPSSKNDIDMQENESFCKVKEEDVMARFQAFKNRRGELI